MVAMAIAAAKDWSSNGRLSAVQPRTTRRLRGAARMTAEGSTAVTSRPEGLAGAGSSADVQHRPGIAERGPDLGGDPRLGSPRHAVGGSDGVVQLTERLSTSRSSCSSAFSFRSRTSTALILAQLAVPAIPAAPVRIHPVVQGPLVDPQVPATCAIGLPVSRTSRTAPSRKS
jgi:hypothetical protein